MQKGRSAAEISQDEEWFLDRLSFVTGKENIIQEKEKPVKQSGNRPDQIEKENEAQAFTVETGRRVIPLEKRAVKHAPKQSEVIRHS